MELAVLFPGQGTQAPGLGRAWTDHPSWSLVELAEDVTGRHLAPLLLDDDPAPLATTDGVQLAVFLASALAWDAVKDSLPAPVLVAGHSLGQITALMAAGVVPFEDAIALVAARAGACQRATVSTPGAMIALLGASPEQADAVVAATGECWLANDNGPGQLVVGGTRRGVAAAGQRAAEVGVRRVVPLSVAGAFHTPLMDSAARELAEYLVGVSWRAASTTVVANDDAAEYTDGEGWEERLVRHLVRPVRWRQTMAALAGKGVGLAVEVGPGTTLTSLLRRAHPGIETRNVSVPSDVAAGVGA